MRLRDVEAEFRYWAVNHDLSMSVRKEAEVAVTLSSAHHHTRTRHPLQRQKKSAPRSGQVGAFRLRGFSQVSNTLLSKL